MSAFDFDDSDSPFDAPSASPAPAPSAANDFSFDDFSAPAPAMAQSSPAPAAAVIVPQPAAPVVFEETPLSRWQAERKTVLMKRSEAARVAKREQAGVGRTEIERYYQDRSEKIARNKTQNRSDEANYKEEMAQVMSNGTDWEKVAKLADFGSAKQGNQARDVDRMRLLHITLKNEKKPAVSSSNAFSF